MDIFIYTSFFILFAFCGYLLYIANKMQRKLKEQDEKHRKALLEAGNAITETLHVAFDSLKKNASDHNKLNSKIVEHNTRIHRLEQHISRTAKNFNQRKMTADDEVPFSRQKTNNTPEDENE